MKKEDWKKDPIILYGHSAQAKRLTLAGMKKFAVRAGLLVVPKSWKNVVVA